MIRPRDITITSSSPRMVPPPVELRQATRYRLSHGALLALVVMVSVYALAGWLAVQKHEHHARPTAAVSRAAGTWAPPAIKADLERHPCAACEP